PTDHSICPPDCVTLIQNERKGLIRLSTPNYRFPKATFPKVGHLLLFCTFLILSYKKAIFAIKRWFKDRPSMIFVRMLTIQWHIYPKILFAAAPLLFTQLSLGLVFGI